PKKSLETIDLEDQKNRLAGAAPVKIDDQAIGSGTIETYTIVYARDRSPSYAVIYGRTAEGNRFIAQTLPDPEVFQLLSSQSMVGESVTLRFDREKKLTLALF
ncbi:MAG: hypothetical protein GY860_08340, partial [Desulfobacteraceae bacterium]|nr:hypothetical protein [Desulfobacteraceae bacterium]